MTGYTIHYTESGGTGTAGAGSTSTDITGLTDGETYTISVEARSEHLSGESEEMTTTLGIGCITIIIHHCCTYYVPFSHRATSSCSSGFDVG